MVGLNAQEKIKENILEMNNMKEIEMKKTKVKMNKSIYLGMSILDTSKTIMYEFWYDCIKLKYQEKVKLLHGY